jgi:hypothetical protein
MPVDPQESVADLFLNCTKNTELTRAHFTRKVTFAVHKNSPPCSGRQAGLGIAFNNQSARQPLRGNRHMKSEEWKTYRTRFLVKAKQLSSCLTFVDHLGRQHCGRKGDYLVESSDGVLSIAPRRIFEDIYVSISTAEQPANEAAMHELKLDRRSFEPLQIEEVNLERSAAGRKRMGPASIDRRDETTRDRRKLPQPCRDRRASDPFVRLM